MSQTSADKDAEIAVKTRRLPETRPARVGVFVDSIGTYGRGVIRGVLAYQRYRQWQLSMLRTWIFQPAAFLDTWEGDGLIAMIPDAAVADSLMK